MLTKVLVEITTRADIKNMPNYIGSCGVILVYFGGFTCLKTILKMLVKIGF